MIEALDPEQTIGKLAESSADSVNRLTGGRPDLSSDALKLQVFRTAAHMFSLHQISVLSSQGTEDVEEIAKIWLRPMRTFEDAFEKISQLVEQMAFKNSDLEDLLKVIIDLRDQARWAYELHGGGNIQAAA